MTQPTTFDAWTNQRRVPQEQMENLRRKWAFLLNRGLSAEEIVSVFDSVRG